MPEPVVLDLAPLPRDQIGPFLLLGLDKDGSRDQIEANWAKRVIWARKGQTRVALEDINWAREMMNDIDRRIRADAASINADTTEGQLRRWCQRFGLDGSGGEVSIGWQPIDQEKPLADYAPPAEMPNVIEVRDAIIVPEIPADVPAVGRLLDELARTPIDPWAMELPA
jgi:hypothetical protein